jgi:microcin C transport system substrate-binding protein
VVAAQALDRVLRHGWYLVPHFYVAAHRVAYREQLEFPKVLPRYYAAQPWTIRTWWRRPEGGG